MTPEQRRLLIRARALALAEENRLVVIEEDLDDVAPPAPRRLARSDRR